MVQGLCRLTGNSKHFTITLTRPLKPRAHVLHRLAADTSLQVIVDQAHRLHEGVGRGRAHKAPSPFFEIFAQGFGGRRLGNPDHGVIAEVDGTLGSFRLERPEITGQGAFFFHQFQSAAGIIDGTLDLLAVADDAGILQEYFYFTFTILCYLLEVKSGKSFPEVFPLPQNGEPAQTRLKTFQADLFE